MNPKIAECWNEALKCFENAKVAFKKGNSEPDIRKKLWGALCHGADMTKQLESGGEESLIAAGIAVENLMQSGQLSVKQSFRRVLQALMDYRNLVPDEYNLPLPIGLDK